MAQKIENFARFYALLKRLPGADKETLVRQYTDGRTDHLHLMVRQEYDRMCRDMESVAGYDERMAGLRRALKTARSIVLHQMQLWGVNTADWNCVNTFCRDRRIAGKEFRQLSQDELERLTVKLRAMRRKRDAKELRLKD